VTVRLAETISPTLTESFQQPSISILWSTLGLWLAGVLGIPVSVTKPLVAVMLYAAAEAGGDWQVLGKSGEKLSAVTGAIRF